MSPRICLFILTSLLETIHEATIVPTDYRAPGSLSYGQSNDRPRSLIASRLCMSTIGDDAYGRRNPAAVVDEEYTTYRVKVKYKMVISENGR
jgi:hypothetical protein